MYDYRNGDFEGLRRAHEALNSRNLIQDSDEINLDWTYWKDAFMSTVSDFIPSKKIKGKKTSRLGSQVKSSTLCGKRRLLAQS